MKLTIYEKLLDLPFTSEVKVCRPGHDVIKVEVHSFPLVMYGVSEQDALETAYKYLLKCYQEAIDRAEMDTDDTT